MEIPGFVDLQVNGYKGIDFSSPDLTEEQFLFACQELIKKGTVAFLPTIITSATYTYERNLRLMAGAMTHGSIRGHVLGFHVEGPFISEENGARGAHNKEWVIKPDKNFLDQLYEWSGENIKLLTIAAEPEGADDLCRHAVKLGIKVSLGHQMAEDAELDSLVTAGACSLTHLGNALPKVLPRHNNPLWSGLANDKLMAMIIADGHHLPYSVLKTIISAKGIFNIAVVSDSSPIAGYPPGRYKTLGNEVELKASGYLYNPHTGYLVGSSSTMLDCMNYLLSLQILNSDELLQVGFYNPLRLINVDSSVIIKSQPGYIQKNERFTVSAS